jgi:hypothetical protein
MMSSHFHPTCLNLQEVLKLIRDLYTQSTEIREVTDGMRQATKIVS